MSDQSPARGQEEVAEAVPMSADTQGNRMTERYNVRVGYVGGPLDTAVPTHLWALSHATEGEVLHEYVRVDLAQGTH